MAADQRKKRMNPSSVVVHTSREQFKVKKKKLDLPRYDLKMKSNILLEWDEKKKSIVSKREQIGISKRDLTPYVNPVAHQHTILADVLAVPQEIFDTRILKEVLSTQVWETCLSEKDRKLLAQFLPKGGDAYEVVQELLSGDNFHFGNPFIKWGETLCSGNFHPDVILQRELSFKDNKRVYYSELQKYHNDMIGNLTTWKERWVCCNDPEKEIVPMMWRSRKAADMSMLIPANESRHRDTNDQHVTTSDSCSRAADEKACASDDLTLMMLYRDSKKRKDFMVGKYDNSSDGINVTARPRKGEKSCKPNIQRGDCTKYMSYIKVSKEQHQRVMSSMKSSGNSIQSKSLNHVLGNLDKFHVRPYEAFEEEERLKLHEHWLQLANIHLPAGLANWRQKQLEKQQLMKSLGQEVHEKVTSLKGDEGDDEDEESRDCVFEDERINVTRNYGPSMDDGNASVPLSPKYQQQHLQPITFSPEFQQLVLDSNDDNVIPKTDNFTSNKPDDYSNMSHMDVTVHQLDHHHHHSSASDVWPAVAMPLYHSTCISNEYAPAPSELSLGNLQDFIERRPTPLIDLEAEIREKDDNTRKLIHRPSEDGSFLNPYPNQDRQDLHQALFKVQGGGPRYHDLMMGRTGQGQMGQFPPVHFRNEPINPSISLEFKQKRFSDLYTNQNMQDNLNLDVGSYSNPRQEQQHFVPVNIQDWSPVNPVNNAHISTSPSIQMDVRENTVSQNWFYGENRGRSVWTGSVIGSNPSLVVNGNTNADHNLFSVMSQCSELGPNATYNPVGPTERLIHPVNYGMVAADSATNILLPQRGNPLNFLGSGHETGSVLKSNNNNNLRWMNLPNQATALQDSMGKTFIRPWNH